MEKIKITAKQEQKIIIKQKNIIVKRIKMQEGENISHNCMYRIDDIITNRIMIMLQEDFENVDQSEDNE